MGTAIRPLMEDGNVRLPNETVSYPPEKWHSLRIDTDATERDTSDKTRG